MMEEKFSIFVEGDEDLRFLKGYLNFLGESFSDGHIESIDGWEKLPGHVQKIEENLDKGIPVFIIFDANKNPQKRREEIKKILGRMPNGKTKNLFLFLFPDDRCDGTLEDLLGRIIIPEHKGIFACFENYIRCLEEKNSEYILPDMKGKMYSYKEAIGALREKKKEHQFDPKYWDFDHSALNPLKKFLTEHIE